MTGIRTVARIAGWGAAGVAAALLAMAALGSVGLSWYSSAGGGAALRAGQLNVIYRGPGTKMTGAPAGFSVGGASQAPTSIDAGSGWIGDEQWSWWVVDGTTIRGGPVPMVPAFRPAVLAAFVRVRLVPLGLGAGAVSAVLLLLCRRGHGAGACPNCGYLLAGLTEGPCPECGVEPLK